MTNDEIAMALAKAEASGSSIKPVREYLDDAKSAYVIQEINTLPSQPMSYKKLIRCDV